MYYFVLILAENIVEEPFLKLLDELHLTEKSAPVRIFRYIKLLFIVMIGEMFFRAQTLSLGFDMFKAIFTDLRFDMIASSFKDVELENWAYMAIIVGTVIVMMVETLKECGVSLRARLEALPTPVRWAFWYVCIFVVVIFGAYGARYNKVALIYAQF